MRAVHTLSVRVDSRAMIVVQRFRTRVAAITYFYYNWASCVPMRDAIRSASLP